MDRFTDACTDGWMGGEMDAWMKNAWMGVCIEGWKLGWMNAGMHQFADAPVDVWMGPYGWMHVLMNYLLGAPSVVYG